MTVVVFGRTGQVARELQARAEVVALDREIVDLSDPDACVAAIEAHAPSVVINAAAYTAVDKAEQEEDLAIVINGEAPAAMARACAAIDIPFVHISTDYVFDGSGATARKPIDLTAPVGAYGRSKLQGETGVSAAGGRYAILRTSWIFSAYGQNFVKTMLNLSTKRDQLNVVADQIGGPTSARSIAAACLVIGERLSTDPSKAGIYHFSGAPDISWAGFAREIFGQAEVDCQVTDITSAEYPTRAQRPQNSCLDCSTTEATFEILRPDWRLELRAVLNEIADREFNENGT